MLYGNVRDGLIVSDVRQVLGDLPEGGSWVAESGSTRFRVSDAMS